MSQKDGKSSNLTKEELIKNAYIQALEVARRPVAMESANYRSAAVVSFDSTDKRVRVEMIIDANTGEFIQGGLSVHPDAS